MPYVYSRPVHLYETDLMGVVHHSNYVRYMEEARFAWLRHENLIQLHGVDANCVFAVMDLQIHYKAPLRWGDFFEVVLNVAAIRNRFRFEAIIRAQKEGTPIVSHGVVVLTCVNNKMQPIKPPADLIKFFNREVKHGS